MSIRSFAVGAALLVPSVLCVSCSDPPPPPEIIRPVRAIRVADRAAIVGRRFPGTAKATQEVELSFRVSGTLASFPMNIGDVVTEGQIVAARITGHDSAQLHAAAISA